MLILVADDEERVRDLIYQSLKAEHDVVLCEDGGAVLKALEKNIVDLVITDHMMPKMFGLEVIKKGKTLSPTTSFMLLTAYGSNHQAAAALRLGAEDYLLKPFEIEELIHRVRRVKELRRNRSQPAITLSPKGLAHTLQQIEAQLIRDTMEECHSDLQKAAERLKLSPEVLSFKWDLLDPKKEGLGRGRGG